MRNKFIHIVISNLKFYKFRTFIVSILILIITAVYVFSGVCIDSFEDGIKNVTAKMGADIVVVSNEYSEEMEKVLFTGEPSTIFFDKSLINGIDKIEGVNKVSSQLLIATLNSSCCAEELQLIALDMKEDFTIKNWDCDFEGDLDNLEMIVGSEVNYEEGQLANFYGSSFKVVGKLKKTGMGYDRSVFINEKTGQKIMSQLNKDSKSISMVLVDTDKEADLGEVCNSINKNLEGTGLVAYKSSEMYSDIVSSIDSISKFINIFEYILLFVSMFAIYAIFTITIDERRREFATYEIIGITDFMKGLIVFLEALATCILGAVVGIILSMLIIKFLTPYLQVKFGIPFYISSMKILTLYSIQGLLMAVAVGCISTCSSVFKVSRASYTKLKEGI